MALSCPFGENWDKLVQELGKDKAYLAFVLFNKSEETNNVPSLEEARKLIDYRYKIADVTKPVYKTWDSKQELEWFNKTIGDNQELVKRVKGLIDGRAFGQFTGDLIYISEQAEAGTLYHEAFHRVFNLLLTPQEVNSLYNEVRNRNINATTFEGTSKNIKDFNDLEIEELLAEEFRDFTLLNGNKKVKESLLAKLFNWLNNLYKNIFSKPNTVEELFYSINKGDFKGKKLLEESLWNTGQNLMTREKSFLTAKETNDLYSGMTTKLFSSIAANNIVKEFVEGRIDLGDVYNNILNETTIDILEEVARIEKTDSARASRLLSIVNYIDSNPDVIISEHSKIIRGLKIKLIPNKESSETDKIDIPEASVKVQDSDDSNPANEEEQSESTGRDMAFNKNSVEYDTKANMYSEIRLLMGALTARDRNGSIIRNELGLPTSIDMEVTYNRVTRTLSGVPMKYDLMRIKLLEKQIQHPEFNELVSLLDGLDESLKTKFLQTMYKHNMSFLAVLKEGSNMYLTNANHNRLEDRIKRDWINNLNTILARRNKGVSEVTQEYLDEVTELLNQDDTNQVAALLGIYNLGSTSAEIDGKTVRDYVRAIANKLTLGIPTIYNQNNKNKVRSFVNKLAAHAAKSSTDVVDLQLLNADGKTVHSITLNSYISTVSNLINYYNEKGELNSLLVEYPELFNVFNKNSIFLKRVKEGNKINVGIATGIIEKNSDGKGTDSLDTASKIIQDFVMVLNGQFPFLRAADRSIENVISLDGDSRLLAQDTDDFQRIMKTYLIDEIMSIRLHKDNNNFKYYKEKGNKFRFFDGILDESKLTGLKEIKNQDFNNSAEELNAIKEFIRQNDFEINSRILQYIAQKNSETLQRLRQEEVVLPSEILNEYGNVEGASLTYTMNAILGNIEITKLFLGDPAFFKNADDFFKRISMFNSTKKGLRTDREFLDWLNVNRERLDGKIPTNTIDTLVYDDVLKPSDYYDSILAMFEESFYLDYNKVHSDTKARKLAKDKAKGYAKAYLELNVADAQGWITLDEAREILESSGDWTEGQEATYQWETQKAQGINNPTIWDIYKGEYVPIIDAMKEPIPVLKLQHTGYQKLENVTNADKRLGVPTGYKFSLFPLLPSIIKDRKLETLYENMKNKQVGITMMDSANKFGRKFNKKRSAFTELRQADIQTIYKQNIGIQLDMGSEFHYSGPRGTQMQKIILSNLDQSKWGKKIEEYNTLFNAETEDALENIKTKFGINQVGDKYVIGEPDKLLALLETTFVAKELPQDLIDTLKVMKERKFYKTDILFEKTKVDNSLLAIIDRRTIKNEKPGGQAVQVSSLGFDKPKLQGSDKLKFYRIENGKTKPMQVMLPYYFKDILFPDVEDINSLDPKLREGVGYRIPTGQKSSIDYFEIVGFLPKEAGNIIVVPEEIVAKAGSDFDVDKMNLYLPAYKIVKGIPEYVERTDMQGSSMGLRKKAIHNRQVEIIKEILSDPSEFRSLLVPIGDVVLKDIKDEYYEITKYKDNLKNYSDAVSPTVIWDKFAAFLGGKRAIGHIATQITNHSLAQISGLKIVDPDALQDTYLSVNPDGALDAQFDRNGDLISEVLAEFETAYVDIAKDPYIFNLNAGTDNTGVLFYLLRRGVPVKEALWFINQPIIRTYSKIKRLNSGFSTDKKISFVDVINKTLNEFGITYDYNDTLVALKDNLNQDPDDFIKQTKVRKVRESYEQLNESTLKKMLGKTSFSTEELLLQFQILDNFIDYNNQSAKLLNLIQAYSADTKGVRGGTTVLRQQIEARQVLRDEGFFNEEALNYLENKSFLSGYNKVQSAALAIDDLSITKDYIKRISEIYYTYSRVQNDDRSRTTFGNLLIQDFLTFVVQTAPNSIFKVDSTLIGNDIAYALGNIKTDYNHPLHDSELIKSLVVEPSDEGNFVKLTNSKMTTNKIDYFKNLFRELYEIDPILGNKIIKLAVNQTGYSKSAYTLTTIIPTELVLNNLIQYINHADNNDINIDDYIVEFFQNNPKFLKFVKPKAGKAPTYPTSNYIANLPMLASYGQNGEIKFWIPSEVSMFKGIEWQKFKEAPFKKKGVYSKFKEYTGDYLEPSKIRKLSGIRKTLINKHNVDVAELAMYEDMIGKSVEELEMTESEILNDIVRKLCGGKK